jgi:hypothetical protein
MKNNKVKIDDKTYTAHYPANHSNIDGIILETWDDNADDRPWANITRYMTICYVLRKGEKDWEKIYEDETCKFKINDMRVGHNLKNVLYALEDESVRRKIDKEDRIERLKESIQEAEENIQEWKQRLMELND